MGPASSSENKKCCHRNPRGKPKRAFQYFFFQHRVSENTINNLEKKGEKRGGRKFEATIHDFGRVILFLWKKDYYIILS